MSISTERVPAAGLRPGDVIISGTQTYVVKQTSTHDDDPMVPRGRIRLTLRKRDDDSLIIRHLRPVWHVNLAAGASHAGE